MIIEEKENTIAEPSDPAAEAGDAAPVTSEVGALRAEANEWRDKYLRQLAEFDNFRKRSKQEVTTMREYVAESLIVSLLPVMDDFERLLGSLAMDEATKKGIQLVYDKLKTFFDVQGVNVMEARGLPFDASRHDALILTPTVDFPAGTVMDVITPGYTMGDRVIRHAKVVVSSEPDEEVKSN